VYGVRDGAVVWRTGVAPGADGSYTALWVENGKLFAYDYAGFDVEINPHTGEIVSSEFVK
jgi:hypothetical protein